MSVHRIVCVEKGRGGIHAVGTGTDPAQAAQRWTVAQVRAAIHAGDRFYTESPTTGKKADVEPFDTIRSTADHVLDNNLDNLRACAWKKN
jgi:hypothetical protein